MSVNLPCPTLDQLFPVPGVQLGHAEAHIRKANRKDLLLMLLAPGSRVAGVFTQNRFCAAPVQVCREHLAGSSEIRALVVNTGCANAGTGETGLADAHATCQAVAQLIGCNAQQVLPFSTGVILEPLPVERLIAGLPSALSNAQENNWLNAAHAIMTTDTQPKAASRRIRLGDKTVTLTGIAKGAGMIKPNMATMLGYIATDAAIAPALLNALVKEAADVSFNSITVDGDTSTNDSFMLIATGQSGAPEISNRTDPNYAVLRDAVVSLAQELAQLIVRDGEGATKFITVNVEQGKTVEECRLVAYAIAHSPLVKTAFCASDPNLGRILAAIGYAGIADLDATQIELYLDDVHVATRGGRHPAYQEADGQRVMQQAEISVRVQLARGSAQATVWTCDLSPEYVHINASYRS